MFSLDAAVTSPGITQSEGLHGHEEKLAQAGTSIVDAVPQDQMGRNCKSSWLKSLRWSDESLVKSVKERHGY